MRSWTQTAKLQLSASSWISKAFLSNLGPILSFPLTGEKGISLYVAGQHADDPENTMRPLLLARSKDYLITIKSKPAVALGRIPVNYQFKIEKPQVLASHLVKLYGSSQGCGRMLFHRCRVQFAGFASMFIFSSAHALLCYKRCSEFHPVHAGPLAAKDIA